MDYYEKEFLKLEEEFHEVMHDYSLFQEDIDTCEKEIQEINDLLEKNDEFYLKKAIDKLKDLIKFVKNTSTSIQNEYERFDKLASIWDEIRIIDGDEKKVQDINNQVMKANKLIRSHSIIDLKEANKIMEELIKLNK